MTNAEVRNLFMKHEGILKASDLKKHGLSNYEISKLIDAEIIERIMKGYYKLSELDMSEIEIISVLLPGSVLCLDSALYYYGYSDRTPMEWHLAVDKDISKSKVQIDYPYIKAYFVEPSLLTIGVEKIDIEGTEVNIFSRDRLICDCLKYESKMDVEVFNKAIINYVKDAKKNISKLMEYAKLRGVEKKVYDKIGMWL